MPPPPEHDYYQLLTVEIDLTERVRSFLCIAFAPSRATPPVDASKSTFLTDVDANPEYSLLAGAAADGTPQVANLVDICGSPILPAAYTPAIAMTRPALPDIAFAIPLEPKPKNFTVGTVFRAWLARGFMYIDEDRELVPAVHARVVAVQ
jgi:hypothetical protein